MFNGYEAAAQSSLSGASPCGSAASLRIVHVTDTYTLENFPSLKTCLAAQRADCEQRGASAICVHTGDFLAPYTLSSIDKGCAMMSVMNATPIDCIMWGNHDGNDMCHKAVMEREREYTGVWINSNMTSHESFVGSSSQVDRHIIEVCSPDGSNRRRIGMCAVLSNDPGLYGPHAFGGATIEDPWETLKAYRQKLELEGVDLVLPLCHLYESEDERTCRDFDFPLVLSGHDHHRVDRVIDGTRLVKPGSNAEHACIVDITWNSSSDSSPRIEVKQIKVADYAPDAQLAEHVRTAYKSLDRLRDIQISHVPPHLRPLTSRGSRERHVSMGVFLCNSLRDGLNLHSPKDKPRCDCAVLIGAAIKGERDYAESESFTYETLLSETVEKHAVFIYEVPGSCLRAGLRKTWQKANTGWLQYSDDIEVDRDGFVVSIAAVPIDLERMYHVASTPHMTEEKHVGSIIGTHFAANLHCIPPADAGVPIRALLLSLFADRAWLEIWNALDTNHDGKIDTMELRRADTDGDGQINGRELTALLEEIDKLSQGKGDDIFVDEVFKEAGATRLGTLTLKEMNAAHSRRLQE
eukprot:TRINITY_DN89755_c0_g1_i1.p1 TRINITY_DN89755_c0_g1~~TRINITY_DN89755_c0_g1_i1.p1  ORF type:complete len:579 (+),score=72.55 TRINITY_DN89755_c0_g1_i1:172-1908(+)